MLHLMWQLNIAITLLSMIVTSIILDDQHCSAPSPCTCLNEFVDCSSKHLSQLPSFNGNSRPSSTTHTLYVYLFSNNLSVIPDNGFNALRQTGATAINIYLYNNQISYIRDSAFAGIESLVHELDLENNRLSSLPVALGKLTALQILYVQGNNLRTIDSSVLKNIGNSLTNFRFGADNFQQWPTNLYFLKYLTKLQVDKLPFKSLANNSFSGLEDTLSTLVIYNSNLEAVPDAICSLQALQTFDFSRNTHLKEPLSDDSLSFCTKPMTNIQTVRFNYNNLTYFPDVFNVFPNASSITVSGNADLYYIPTEPLINTTHVNLNDLNLDRNHFSSIPHVIGKLYNLTTLSLKNNFIRVIDGDVFHKLSQLKMLQLNDNPIMYIESTAFSGLTALARLDLTSTSLSAIPEATMSLPSLATLNLENLTINCTCELTHHMVWLQATNVTISGKCSSGSFSIQDYVRHYLPLCK